MANALSDMWEIVDGMTIPEGYHAEIETGRYDWTDLDVVIEVAGTACRRT